MIFISYLCYWTNWFSAAFGWCSSGDADWIKLLFHEILAPAHWYRLCTLQLPSKGWTPGLLHLITKNKISPMRKSAKSDFDICLITAHLLIWVGCTIGNSRWKKSFDRWQIWRANPEPLLQQQPPTSTVLFSALTTLVFTAGGTSIDPIVA